MCTNLLALVEKAEFNPRESHSKLDLINVKCSFKWMPREEIEALQYE
jgi:hypothetical protein